MSKPEKRWVIGEKIFPDYQSALAYARNNQEEALRQTLTTFIEHFIIEEGAYGEISTNSANELARRLQLNFAIKPRSK